MINYSTNLKIQGFYRKGDNEYFSYLHIFRLKIFILINFHRTHTMFYKK